jgi:hypothetical protein
LLWFVFFIVIIITILLFVCLSILNEICLFTHIIPAYHFPSQLSLPLSLFLFVRKAILFEIKFSLLFDSFFLLQLLSLSPFTHFLSFLLYHPSCSSFFLFLR